MGGRVIARAKHPEICDATGWPALPSRQSAWSTPELSRTQPWIAAKGRTSNKPPQQLSVQLENRFTLLLQDPKLLKYQIFLLRTQLWKTAHYLDYCVSVLLLHREDVLNRNFTHLMSTLCFLTLSLFIHGPMPPVRRGFRERDSADCRLWTPSTQCTWLTSWIFFFDRRHLIKEDGLCNNKSGCKTVHLKLILSPESPIYSFPAKEKKFSKFIIYTIYLISTPCQAQQVFTSATEPLNWLF